MSEQEIVQAAQIAALEARCDVLENEVERLRNQQPEVHALALKLSEVSGKMDAVLAAVQRDIPPPPSTKATAAVAAGSGAGMVALAEIVRQLIEFFKQG